MVRNTSAQSAFFFIIHKITIQTKPSDKKKKDKQEDERGTESSHYFIRSENNLMQLAAVSQAVHLAYEILTPTVPRMRGQVAGIHLHANKQ